MDYEFNRRTVISLQSGGVGLYPQNDLLPSDTLFPSGTSVYIDGYGHGITSSSLRVSEVLCNGLKFGEYCSNAFSCELYNMGEYDYVGWEVQVYQIVDDDTVVPCFTGRIESAKKDRTSTSRSIVAYDEMYFKKAKNVAEWWENFWAEEKRKYRIANNIPDDAELSDNAVTVSLKELRTSLTLYCGFVENAKPLLNDDLPVYKYDTFTNVSFGDLMRMICELQLCFPNINRSGQLEYVEIGNETADITDNVENYNATYEDYTTAAITGVGYYASSSELIQMRGDGANVYPISGNIFLNIQPVETIDSVLDGILSRLRTISYRPCNVPIIVSDWSIPLGASVETPMGASYVMRNEFSGSAMVNQTISAMAEGETLSTQVVDVNSQILTEKRINTLKRDIDETISYIRGENGIESMIRQTNDLIQLKVGKDEVVSSINASQEGIAIRADLIAFGSDETLESYKGLFNDMEELGGYVAIRGDNLVLGNPEAMTQARLTSEQLQFIVADEVMAFFSANALKLMANLMIGDEWEWDNDTDNKTLTLRYMGE